MKQVWRPLFIAVVLISIAVAGCRNPAMFPAGSDEDPLPQPEPPRMDSSNYAAYYGPLTSAAVDQLSQFELVIVHPDLNLALTTDELRRAVNHMQVTGPRTTVIAYISVGEDVRVTPDFTLVDGRYQPEWAALTADRRFFNPDSPDDSAFAGPVVDPRGDEPHPDGAPLTTYYETGETSGDGGWASYYLDDGDRNNAATGGDGRPDYNPNFGSFFVNVGDPAWYRTLRGQTRAADGHYGIAELIGSGGLGFDGLFLDTIDTMGPNSYTNPGDPVPSEYEWTAPGLPEFLNRLTRDYPDAQIVQNRGLFFFDPRLAHYRYNAAEHIDYVMFESYRLDSLETINWTPQFYRENKKRIRQLLMVAASGASSPGDGFTVLSLGYAEGPSAEAEVSADVEEATASGFLHYITNERLTEIRFDAFDTRDADENPDTAAPVWSSTGYVNLDAAWQDAYSQPLIPRVGIQHAQAGAGGNAELTFDIALDRSSVEYVLYHLNTTDMADDEIPTGDSFISQATEVVVTPAINRDYAEQYVTAGGFPVYSAQNEPPPAFTGGVDGFDSGRRYHLLLRARDPSANETANTALTELVF